jgi:hypothetical protein
MTGAIVVDESATSGYTSTLSGAQLSFDGTGCYISAEETTTWGLSVSNCPAINFSDSTSQTTAGISDASSDGKAYSRKDATWVYNRINSYDSAVTYQVGDQVVYGYTIYQLTMAPGGPGYDPVYYSSYWTAMNAGSPGADGENGTNGTDGADGADGASIVYRGTYDGMTPYVVNDWAVYSGLPYICIMATTGNDPTNTTYWLPLYVNGTNGTNGTDGADGTDGTNGLSGSMNYLDIMTITSKGYGAYVSSGAWSVNYNFLHSGDYYAGWFENKCPTVYFNLYVNGTFDSAVSGSYDYYYASGSPVTTSFSTGDHIEVKISDGTFEATINYADFYF